MAASASEDMEQRSQGEAILQAVLKDLEKLVSSRGYHSAKSVETFFTTIDPDWRKKFMAAIFSSHPAAPTTVYVEGEDATPHSFFSAPLDVSGDGDGDGEDVGVVEQNGDDAVVANTPVADHPLPEWRQQPRRQGWSMGSSEHHRYRKQYHRRGGVKHKRLERR